MWLLATFSVFIGDLCLFVTFPDVCLSIEMFHGKVTICVKAILANVKRQ